MKLLYAMVLRLNGRDLAKFTASLDLEAKPTDPKIRVLFLDAIERNGGHRRDAGKYEMSIIDYGTNRELHKYVDTEAG